MRFPSLHLHPPTGIESETMYVGANITCLTWKGVKELPTHASTSAASTWTNYWICRKRELGNLVRSLLSRDAFMYLATEWLASAKQTDSPWLLLDADTDTQDTQKDTVGCCGLAAEEQVFSRMHGLAVWLAGWRIFIVVYYIWLWKALQANLYSLLAFGEIFFRPVAVKTHVWEYVVRVENPNATVML